MEEEIRNYIDNLNIDDIPWHRMFTAYGTAENYGKILPILEQTTDIEEWDKKFNDIYGFEHQGTLFPPAPFVLVFLVRILKKQIANSNDIIVKKLLDQFLYNVDICNHAENMEHAQPLEKFSDMLNEKYLLLEMVDDEELDELFEDPDAFPDTLFFSCYYYSKAVLLQVHDILDKFEKYHETNEKLKSKFCV